MLDYGVARDVPNSAYHGDRNFISSSGLKAILKNPKEYKRVYLENGETEQNDGMILGSLVHSLFLEPEKTFEEFAVYPKRRQGQDWEKFKFDNEDKIIVTSTMFKQAEKLVKKLNESKLVQNLFKGGEPELSYGVDLDGIPFKFRPDYQVNINKHFVRILDLKTTKKDISNDFVIQEIIDGLGYDLSGASYKDGLEVFHNGNVKCEIVLVFISTYTGAIKVKRLNADNIEEGRKKYKAAITQKKYFESLNWQIPDGTIEDIGPLYHTSYITGKKFREIKSKAS